jgi:hypothetical protein
MKTKYIVIAIVIYLLFFRRNTEVITPTYYATKAELDQLKKDVGYLREEFNNREFS